MTKELIKTCSQVNPLAMTWNCRGVWSDLNHVECGLRISSTPTDDDLGSHKMIFAGLNTAIQHTKHIVRESEGERLDLAKKILSKATKAKKFLVDGKFSEARHAIVSGREFSRQLAQAYDIACSDGISTAWKCAEKVSEASVKAPKKSKRRRS
jgi:hypothetical protein